MVVESAAPPASAPGDTLDLSRFLTVRGRRPEPADLAVAVVVTVGAVLQWVALRTAGPLWSDVASQAALVRRPLSEALLDTGAGAGPAPDGGVLVRAGAWFLGQTVPLQSWPVHGLGVALRAVLAVGVWLLLRRLLRPGPALVVPVAVVAVSPALFLTAADLSTVLGPLAAVTAAVWCAVVVHGRRGARRTAVAAALAATAVLADRSGAAVVVALVCLVLADRWPGRAARRCSVVAAVGAVVAAGAVLAVPGLRPGDLDGLRAGAAPDVVRAVFRATTGALTGAPWQWSAPQAWARTVPAVPDAAAAAGLFAVCLVLVVGARASARRTVAATALGLCCASAGVLLDVPDRPQASGALLWATVTLAVAAALAALRPRPAADGDGDGDGDRTVAPTALAPADERPTGTHALAPGDGDATAPPSDGRAPDEADQVDEESSETSDAAAPDATAVSAAVPNEASNESSTSQTSNPAPNPASNAASEGAERSTSSLALAGLHPSDVVPSLVAAGLAVALVAAAVPSAVTLGRATADDPVGAWVATTRTSLAALLPFPRITSRLVPKAVTGPVVRRPLDTDVVRMVRPDALVHDADGALAALDDGGRVTTATVSTLATSAPADFCAATVQPGQDGDAVVPLQTPVTLPDDAQVRLEMLVTGTTSIVAGVERTDGSPLTLRRWTDDVLYQGPHTVLLPVGAAGTLRAVRVGATRPDAGLCIISARVVRVP